MLQELTTASVLALTQHHFEHKLLYLHIQARLEIFYYCDTQKSPI